MVGHSTGAVMDLVLERYLDAMAQDPGENPARSGSATRKVIDFYLAKEETVTERHERQAAFFTVITLLCAADPGFLQQVIRLSAVGAPMMEPLVEEVMRDLGWEPEIPDPKVEC